MKNNLRPKQTNYKPLAKKCENVRTREIFEYKIVQQGLRDQVDVYAFFEMN